jgi:starch-binding outer membrane protein, SusD/RagB family
LQQEIAAMVPEQIIDGALGTYSPKLEIYPIPQAQINANPNLEQNDGWK